MSDFHVNLVGSSVPPPHKRRKTYWAMVAYLAITGGVLAWSANRATWQLLNAGWKRADIGRLEREFRQEHPQHPDLVVYAKTSGAAGQRIACMLEDIHGTLQDSGDAARILFGLATHLPEGSYLVEFDLDQGKKQVTFDVATPITEGATRLPSAGDMVALWNQDATLAGNVRKITSVASKRRTLDGHPVFVLRFTGILPGQGA